MFSIINILKQKQNILILGFGREGRSTYNFIRSTFPEKVIAVGDENKKLTLNTEIQLDNKTNWFLGPECYNNLAHFDLIIKSPGIPLRKLKTARPDTITSQTDLFLQQYHRRTIGISGTKGKSTTTALAWHILQQSGLKALLAGNIGIPVFDLIHKMDKNTVIVMELSAHQGEILKVAPSTMVLLNIYQEHLDHFGNFSNYKNAKLNFCRKQQAGDTYIYNMDDPILLSSNGAIKGVKYVGISHQKTSSAYKIEGNTIFGSNYCFNPKHNPLKGRHNLTNIAAAIAITQNQGLSEQQINSSIQSFQPLEHRLEYAGKYGDIIFYNDSISTVPEATIAAIDALEEVRYVILGGYDRGIDYLGLVKYLKEKTTTDLLLVGEAGNRIAGLAEKEGLAKSRINKVASVPECVKWVSHQPEASGICLFSPAASSYDSYKNFEERGSDFKSAIRHL